MIYGRGIKADDNSLPFIVKMNSDATILDHAVYDEYLSIVAELSNNKMVMVTYDFPSKSLHIIDENLDISFTKSVSNLDINYQTITSRPDLDVFYYDRNKFDNEGNLIFSNDPGTRDEVELSVTNDGGLLVGDYGEPPAYERGFFLEKLASTDGSSEWEVKEPEVPPYGVQAAYELSNGFIIGVSYLWGDGGTTDISIFKVNSQGEF